MIVVNAIVQSSREDIVAMQGTITTMETASRAEAGCLDYTFSVELNDPTVLRITEKWESLDALKAHFQTQHMADFQEKMGEVPPRSLEITIYEAQEIKPFG
jgi:quinol monooxygenase YgiN